jgi:hypothetical protein
LSALKYGPASRNCVKRLGGSVNGLLVKRRGIELGFITKINQGCFG